MSTKAEAIGIMLAGFNAGRAAPELTAVAYMTAVSDCSDYAVSRAVGEYVKGAVPKHDNGWAPTCAQLAERARLHDSPFTPRLLEQVSRDPKYLSARGWDPAAIAEAHRRLNDGKIFGPTPVELIPRHPVVQIPSEHSDDHRKEMARKLRAHVSGRSESGHKESRRPSPEHDTHQRNFVQ